MHRSLPVRMTIAGLAAVLATISLTPPAHAADATGIFTGRLLDHHGAPAAGVRVVATNEYNDDSTTSGVTDHNGTWSITVPPGGYTIDFALGGGRQWLNGTLNEDDAAWLTVADGQTVTANDTLLPTGTITGHLVDTAGKAIPDAAVTLFADGFSTSADRFSTTKVQTDHSGGFTFGYLLPGSYKVKFTLPDGAAQWAYGQSTHATATPITVTAGVVTTVNNKLVAPGTIAGLLTTSAGTPIAGMMVMAYPAIGNDEEDRSFGATTDAKGRYAVTDVLPGTYRVAFIDHAERMQYAYGSGSREAGSVFTVRSGKTTTVNDKQVAPATLRITAVDATTGKAQRSFCADVPEAWNAQRCTTTGAVVLSNLPAGPLSVDVTPAAGSFYLHGSLQQVKAQAGKTVGFAAKLELGGTISASVIDRSTAKPVKDACIGAELRAPGDVGDGDGFGCAATNGTAVTTPVAPGSYNVFVYALKPYGDQWLGATGGTGDERAAAKITVRAGKVTAAPLVRLDKGGSITGTVSTAAGKPVRYGHAWVYAWGYEHGVGGGGFFNRIGHYTLDDLGPYQWALVFGTDRGRQWSGGKGNRYAATTIQVIAGKTVTHDETILPQSTLTGTVRLPTATPPYSYLTAYTVSTGDPIGHVTITANGTYAMLVPGGEQVKIGYDIQAYTSSELTGWYDHASTWDKAKVVNVPATGAKTLNISIG